MSAIYAPHAAALARELEAELQELDALQQLYVQRLIDQLSDTSFLTLEDAEASSQRVVRSFSPAPHFPKSTRTALDEESQSSTHGARNASHKAHFEIQPSQLTDCKEKGRIPRISDHTLAAATSKFDFATDIGSSLYHVNATTGDKMLDLCRREEKRQSLAFPVKRAPRPAAGSPARLQKTPPPLPQPSRRVEEARRARRALRCIREDRDAHFNAKARRAQELLREGREAMRKSRERRLADESAAHNTRVVKA